MRWSQTLIPTLREAPADAEIASHRLLLRAGIARRLAGGVYTFLPLGLRSLRKLERIVREEMDAAGAIEVLMPALQPGELWRKGPRFDAARAVMFRASSAGRKADGDMFLGPTHEEVVTDLMAGTVNSYRQLPRTLYQIQTKFRDEIRPRFGLMRAREFVMKDAYSFDVSETSADASYRAMYEAYRRIFARAGLTTMIVEADTGVMGGSFSHEFAVPCEIGESEIAFTDDGSYAATIEKAVARPEPRTRPSAPTPAPEKFPTPGVTTIEDLDRSHGVAARDQIKTLVYLCESKLVMFLVRGDHQLSEAKVGTLGFAEFRPATPEEIFAALGAHPGSLGGVGKVRPAISRIYADSDLRDECDMVTGANEDGFHLRHVDIGRDIAVDEYRTLREIRDGEPSPDGKPLRVRRAIEVGHVFKLGTKYSEALGAEFLDENGKSHPMFMGCYGIGVTRSLQAIIEQHHDDDGIIWPAAVAPFHALVTLIDSSLAGQAKQLHDRLEAAGIDTLLDDRPERPGVKFKDADLIGIPVRITVGEKSWKAGGVEIKARTAKEKSLVPIDRALDAVKALLAMA
ncbi:MAG: proline--tRNA ligase [Verrucomicrobiae bacterium]|nr:proline--tRNA ligase [Verrucomicrobiae bacterium]